MPLNPNKSTAKNKAFNDLDMTLKQMTFNEIIADLDYHFENCFVTNFDLIHHECKGDSLSFSRKYYETIFNEITSKTDQNLFISSAITSERKDMIIEKEILRKHFNREILEENLQKKVFFYRL